MFKYIFPLFVLMVLTFISSALMRLSCPMLFCIIYIILLHFIICVLPNIHHNVADYRQYFL